MRRSLRFAAIAAAFVGGLAAGLLLRPPEDEGPPDQRALVADLRGRIAGLQKQLRDRELAVDALENRLQTLAEADSLPVVATIPPETLAPVKTPDPAEEPHAEVADEPEESTALAAPQPPPTEEAALDLFRRFLEKTGGMGWQQRMQHARALLDELRAIGEPAVTALLEKLEEGEDVRERSAAARLLGALQDPSALPALQEVLELEEDLMLRRAAARGLQLLETPDAVPVFETILADRDDDRFVRLSAAYGLAQLGEPGGMEGLVALFDEAGEDGRGRFLVFRSITTLNDAGALPLMRRLATAEDDVAYRIGAIRFLADHDDREALPLLEQVLNSPHEQLSVVEAAEQAYGTIADGQ
jgi:HEAT repeat protein